MSNTTFAFPDRPLTARPPGHGIGRTVFSLAGAVLLLVTSLALAIDPIPDLWADWQIRDTARPVPGATIENGSCWNTDALVHCAGTLVAYGSGRSEVRRKINDYFVDFHFHDYTAVVMADPARPGHLTTNLALDKFWNRVLTYAIATPIFILCALAWIFEIRSTERKRAAVRTALRDKVMRPVLMKLDAIGPRAWVMLTHGPKGGAVRHKWAVPARSKPIVMDSRRRLILGVKAEGGNIAMPLDLGLRWLDLTAAERAALLAGLPPQPDLGTGRRR